MSRRPRWLRERDRLSAPAVQVENLHRYVDRVWLDQCQLMRAFGVKNTLQLHVERDRARREGGDPR